MKAIQFSIIAALLTVSGVRAESVFLGFQEVSAQGNFLYNAPNDNCSNPEAAIGCNMSPTVIDLGAYVGGTVSITDVGSLCVFSGTDCTLYPASASYLGAVFSSSATLLGPQIQDRVPDSVSAGLPDITSPYLNSWAGDVDTTIPNDFYLPAGSPLVVTIPARYLIIGVLDSGFSDNSSPLLGVDITVSPVPEPSTWMLLIFGAAAIALRRRFVQNGSRLLVR